MATNAKVATNPLHAAFPQLFKRTGEVRRHPKAGRFTRKVSIMASKKAPALLVADSITIEVQTGLLVISPMYTKMMREEDGTIEALLINGWNVVVSTPDNYYEVSLVQQEMFTSQENE